MKYINGVLNAPEAIGPYSQAVVSGNFLFLSGQIPLNPETGDIVEGGIEQQTKQVMKNIFGVLDHCGVDFSHVVKTTIYLTDMKSFQQVNSVYSEWLGDYRPARSTVQVAALPLGVDIEIEVLAVIELHDIAMQFDPQSDSPDATDCRGYTMKESN